MRNLTLAITFSATLFAIRPAAAFQATFDFRNPQVGTFLEYNAGDTITGTSGATLQVTGFEQDGAVGKYYADWEGSAPMVGNTTDGLRAFYQAGNISGTGSRARFDFTQPVKLVSMTFLLRTNDGTVDILADFARLSPTSLDRGTDTLPVTRTIDSFSLFPSGDSLSDFRTLDIQARGGAWSLVSLTVDYPSATAVPEPSKILGLGIALGFGAYKKRESNSEKSARFKSR